MGFIKAIGMCLEYAYGRWHWNHRNDEEDEDMEGKVVIITGGNTGLGKATATELAKMGATIVLACRNVEKGLVAVNEIKCHTPNANIVVMKLDLGSMRSCYDFQKEFVQNYQELHILINNAGVYGTKRSYEKLNLTEDGFEPHFGINYLGHFLLTRLLLPVLKKSNSSRIICVSSAMYLMSNLNLDDPMLEKIQSSPWDHLGYSNSKLALILFTVELSRRLEGAGVRTYAVCPGVVDTEIHDNQEGVLSILLDKLITTYFGFSPTEGCETILHCAVSRETGNDSGKMYRFNKEWDLDSFLVTKGIAAGLWDKSSDILGISRNISNSNKEPFWFTEK